MEIEAAPLSPEEFAQFRANCGWGEIAPDVAALALRGSLAVLTLREDGELRGFVRLVGDGALNIYIQDLIVRESDRGLGHGRTLMQAALDWIDAHAPHADVGLMAAEGLEHYYFDIGFAARPADGFGAGMMRYAKGT